MDKTILVVDDDPELRELLQDHLGRNGYRVLVAGDGQEMWQAVDRERVDLVILDLMLPGEDGLSLCRNLRARSSLPILMLSARGDEMDRVIGLEMGADDYIPKPFSPRELLARVRSALRRAGENQQRGNKLSFAGWTLDLDARYLIDAQGVVVPLSSGEFRLMKAFVENANRVLSRNVLMETLAGRDQGPFDRSVDVMISRLRRRLGDDGREPDLIKTLRNEGYILTARVERHP